MPRRFGGWGSGGRSSRWAIGLITVLLVVRAAPSLDSTSLTASLYRIAGGLYAGLAANWFR